jgi:hypothetical protein
MPISKIHLCINKKTIYMIALKKILFVNGASSAVTALGLIAFPTMMADLFQLHSSTIFVSVGIFLLTFAALVLFEAGSASTKPKRVQFIILMDLLWVVASVVTVVSMLGIISGIGNLLIIAVALWVVAMAYLQARGLRQTRLA